MDLAGIEVPSALRIFFSMPGLRVLCQRKRLSLRVSGGEAGTETEGVVDGGGAESKAAAALDSGRCWARFVFDKFQSFVKKKKSCSLSLSAIEKEFFFLISKRFIIDQNSSHTSPDDEFGYRCMAPERMPTATPWLALAIQSATYYRF